MGEVRAGETRLVQRAYRFAVAPTPDQLAQFSSHAGGARFAYNWGLATYTAALEARQAEKDAGGEPVTKLPGHFDLCKQWTAYKDAHTTVPDDMGRTLEWVGENFVGSYQAALRDAAGAWQKFWDSRNGTRGGRWMGRPRFKKKGRAPDTFQLHGASLRMLDQCTARAKGYTVQLPKIGAVHIPREVRVGGHVDRNNRVARSLTRTLRKPAVTCPPCAGTGSVTKLGRPDRVLKDGTTRPGTPDTVVTCPTCKGATVAPSARIIRATISRGASGVWWCSITAEVAQHIPAGPSKRQAANGIVGLDLGTRYVAVDSDGTVYPNPQHLATALTELRVAQRALSRCAPESKRRDKARRRVGAIHERVASLRKDSANRVTTRLARTFAGVAVEGWDVQQVAARKDPTVPTPVRRRRNRQLADAAPGLVRWQLAYKTSWYGSTFFKGHPHQGTGRTCSRCWSVKTKPVQLGQDMFTCDTCGTSLDRRVNAARVIKAIAGGGYDPGPPQPVGPTEPRGGGVRPDTSNGGRRPPVKRVARGKPPPGGGHT